ncbi:hypothetical protein [Enterococcus faecalis]|uniref:hypothetical protein n=1 Tax=Enterococcus faecalis TaxID=1351 RepID=UPI00045A0D1E|nr:hypothetical protein [Enterococcus faecalis]KAJ83803.1 hypothetical protein P791_2219 [Enterococcus faecalis NY9]
MYSNKQKRRKFVVNIGWLMLTTLFSLIVVFKTKQTEFWTYTLIMYMIPIIINLFYFVRIYDFYEDETDFCQKFMYKYKGLEETVAKFYFKRYEKANLMIRCFCVMLFLSTIVMIFLTCYFSEIFKNSLVFYCLYTLLYLGYFFSSAVEKMMSRRLDKDPER